MYVTPWLMCAFTALPLWDGVMAIWDMMMLKGRSAPITAPPTPITAHTSARSLQPCKTML